MTPPTDAALQVRLAARRSYLVIALLIMSGLPLDGLGSGAFSWWPVVVRAAWSGVVIALAFLTGAGRVTRAQAAFGSMVVSIFGMTSLAMLTGGGQSYLLAALPLCPLVAFALSPDSRFEVFATLGLAFVGRLVLQLHDGASRSELGFTALTFLALAIICWWGLQSVRALHQRNRRSDLERIGALEQLHQLERERFDTERRAATEQRLLVLGRLAAGVAHEVNNPLAALHANLATLGDQAKDLLSSQRELSAAAQKVLADPNAGEAARALAARVDGRGRTLEELEDLLAMAGEMTDSTRRIAELSGALAQLAGGRQETARVPLELRGALASWFPAAGTTSGQRTLHIHDGEPLWVRCAVPDLGEGLKVLLAFLRKQPHPLPVELSLSASRDGVVLEVFDPGFRLPAGADSELFSPRIEVDAPSKRMKTEMALVLAHAYLTRAGAEAQLLPRGGGACVRVTLLRAEPLEAQPQDARRPA